MSDSQLFIIQEAEIRPTVTITIQELALVDILTEILLNKILSQPHLPIGSCI
jgi:hypothetical protein